jgi:DNA-directed RNA polymerase subunit N (RpoN/RPB10)
MIIPVRCISCSKVLADNYREYMKRIREKQPPSANGVERVEYLTKFHTDEKTIKGKIMDDLGIKNPCCRTHYLTHVDVF